MCYFRSCQICIKVLFFIHLQKPINLSMIKEVRSLERDFDTCIQSGLSCRSTSKSIKGLIREKVVSLRTGFDGVSKNEKQSYWNDQSEQFTLSTPLMKLNYFVIPSINAAQQFLQELTSFIHLTVYTSVLCFRLRMKRSQNATKRNRKGENTSNDSVINKF